MWIIALTSLAGVATLAVGLALGWRLRQTRGELNRRVIAHLWREAAHFRMLAASVRAHVETPLASRALLQLAGETLHKLRSRSPADDALSAAIRYNDELLATLQQGQWPAGLDATASPADGTATPDSGHSESVARQRLLLNDALRLMHRARHRGLISASEHRQLEQTLREARTRLEINGDLQSGDAAAGAGDFGRARSHFNRARRRLAENNNMEDDSGLLNAIDHRLASIEPSVRLVAGR